MIQSSSCPQWQPDRPGPAGDHDDLAVVTPLTGTRSRCFCLRCTSVRGFDGHEIPLVAQPRPAPCGVKCATDLAEEAHSSWHVQAGSKRQSVGRQGSKAAASHEPRAHHGALERRPMGEGHAEASRADPDGGAPYENAGGIHRGHPNARSGGDGSTVSGRPAVQ
jgi:hypothetical protein